MTLTRQAMLEALLEEKKALLDLLPCFDDAAWHTLSRADGWSVHDIVAHIADTHLSTVAISGVSPRAEWAAVGVTLPMQSNGRVNMERLNMLRYQLNRQRTRDAVMKRLVEGFTAVAETVQSLDDARLAGPGPYGPPETMLEWFYAVVGHNREHRLELERMKDREGQA
jgi:hypothetical protein